MVAIDLQAYYPGFDSADYSLTIEPTVTFSSALTLSSTVAITGAATLSSTLAVTGLITASAGIVSTSETVTPAADGSADSLITPGVTSVTVAAVTNDADDWIILPAIASVPDGHEITILCNAGGAFEIRTPASSNTKINTVDSDGTTKELTAVDTEVIKIQKVSTADGWIARSFTALGADNTALVPDA